MSTMKKRIPMFLLALAMMVAMALPTFAASPPYSARVWIPMQSFTLGRGVYRPSASHISR